MNVTVQMTPDENSIEVVYFRIGDEEVARTVEIAEDACYVDEAEDGQIIGIEIFDMSIFRQHIEDIAARYAGLGLESRLNRTLDLVPV